MNPTFMLGGELEVRRLGFGAMRVVEDREEGVRVLRRAVELGVTLIDTADIYGAGASEEIVAEALSDPDAKPLTPEQLARMRRVSRVKALRQRLGMTQEAFALAFHLPITTLRDWEQRRSKPDAPARALLLAIERDPDAMKRLLAEPTA